MHDPEHDGDYYIDGSWDSYEVAHDDPKQNSRTYLPTPGEIEQRKNILVWLQIKGFSKRFIYSAMRDRIDLDDVDDLLVVWEYTADMIEPLYERVLPSENDMK